MSVVHHYQGVLMKNAKLTAIAGSVLVMGTVLAGPATAAMATPNVAKASAEAVRDQASHPGISARLINDSPYGMNIKVTNQDGLLNWRHINRNDVYRVDSCSTASDRVSWTRIDFDYDGGTRADGHRSLLITNPVASSDPIKATWSDSWGGQEFDSTTFGTRGDASLADSSKSGAGRTVALAWKTDNMFYNTHVFEVTAKKDGVDHRTPAAPAALTPGRGN